MSQSPETQPIRPEHRLDEPSLARALRHQVPGAEGPMRVEQMAGGQSNPTYLLRFAETELVMRKQPPGKLLPSAHAVDREYRVLRALWDTDVPVPEALWLCEDPTVVGTPFYVMQRLRGRVFRDTALPDQDPATRRAIYEAMDDTLVALHAVDPARVGLADFGKAGNYFARQVARWSRQYEATRDAPRPALEQLMAWLPAHIPEGDEARLCHGDYRLENLMFHPERPEVIGVLDWELSTLGHPLADLGYTLIPYYLRGTFYGGLAEHNLEALGIPDAEAFVARYETRSGRAGLGPFHIAFGCFRLAVILEGVAARSRAGNAASDDAADVGALSEAFAQLGCERVDL